jgi:predicted ATP-grasp superfamily ATP-dependent carboligase
VPRRYYVQQFVDGTPGSVVFAAARGLAVPIGMSWQLIGERAFGATGFQYCGSILTCAGEEDALLDNASALCRVVAEEFGVVGVNGIDFVNREGVAYAVEVNPRWSASMELVERAYRLSVFGAHAAACADGVLPAFDLARAQRGGAAGKAVIFARRDVVVGNTRAWLKTPAMATQAHVAALLAESAAPASSALEIAEIRDIPHPGDRIAAGRPVCTVLAGGRDRAACHAALVRLAERVYADLAAWEREVA